MITLCFTVWWGNVIEKFSASLYINYWKFEITENKCQDISYWWMKKYNFIVFLKLFHLKIILSDIFEVNHTPIALATAYGKSYCWWRPSTRNSWTRGQYFQPLRSPSDGYLFPCIVSMVRLSFFLFNVDAASIVFDISQTLMRGNFK